MPMDKWDRREYMKKYHATHPRKSDKIDTTGKWHGAKAKITPQELKIRSELARKLLAWMQEHGETFESLHLSRDMKEDVTYSPDRIGKVRQAQIREIIGEPVVASPRVWRGPSDADVVHCKRCVYWDQTNYCCDYALAEHQLRGCRGDVNCKRFREGEHDRRWERLALSP